MRNESSSDTVATFAAYGLAKVARPGHARWTARLANPERDIARLAMATTAVPSCGEVCAMRLARPRSSSVAGRAPRAINGTDPYGDQSDFQRDIFHNRRRLGENVSRT